jgi:O-antigen ligase
MAAVAYVWHRTMERRRSTTHPFVPISLGVLVVAAVAFSAAQLDFRKVEARFNSLFQDHAKDISVTQRIAANAASMEMLDRHWLRGVGAGGFRHLYPVHIQHHPVAYNGGRLFWQNAHNDWLQIPIELGATGAALLLFGAGYWIVGLARRRVWLNVPVLLLVLGLAQTLLHATFDFPLQNPAVLITWCAFATLALRRLELGDARR